MSMLLISGLNADIFQDFKDAALKAGQQFEEAQKKLNNPLNEDVNVEKIEAAPAIQNTHQFNSLAEEAAFKKQQEQQKNANKKSREEELKNVIIPRIKVLRTSEASFYQKYFVNEKDTKEQIDKKFQNKAQLFQDMQKDFTNLDTERKELYNFLNDDNYPMGKSDIELQILGENFKERHWSGELSSIFANIGQDYVGYCSNYENDKFMSWSDELTIDILNGNNHTNADYYAKYLKCTYVTYEKRQKKAQEEKQKAIQQAQAQKQQQLSLANEKKERQRVQGACQAWRTKANRMVYSLGVGDKVMKNSAVFIIQGANANTFLVNALGYNIYLQKSDCIAYEALKTAPSPYCYQ